MSKDTRKVTIGDQPVNLGTRFGRLAAGSEVDLTQEEAKRVVEAKAGHYSNEPKKEAKKA
jgi:hypothetical protein